MSIATPAAQKSASSPKSFSALLDQSPSQAFEKLSPHTRFESGLVPPFVRSIRQMGRDLQIVLVAQPDINLLMWGEYERGPYKDYLVAQPYRVIVGHWVWSNLPRNEGWCLLGARMFYSPTEVVSLDQPLYLQNVPNINTIGYGNTSVGWVCLYHTDKATKDLPTLIHSLDKRTSGQEPYNNANMSGTDGTRYYKKHSPHIFLSNPLAWEQKTEKEGLDWVRDPDLWIMAKVDPSPTSMQYSVSDKPNAVSLTLRKVMYEPSAFYYSDKRIKDFNKDIQDADALEIFNSCL